ncbi:MAG: recombination mediator RecR [Sphaerochaetaceae bacterium]|nr:recombination mediator RecR [Sphaerochaetaceae bacterium]
MQTLEQLIRHLSKLPGIGVKSASRLAYHLIQTDKEYNRQLAHTIETIQDVIFPCSICNSFSESDPCEVCSSASRDRSIMCVVEQPQDVLTISNSGAYNGLFHVLGGALSPLDGIGPNDLDFRKLLKRIDEGDFKEVIIATNPTEEGDTTAMYLRHLLKDYPLSITRIASGLPIGGDLEYADKITLSRALRSRVSYNE